MNFASICKSISDLDIHLDGYTVFRRDRNRHGGGVLIYVDEHLPVKRVSELEFERTESIWVEIQFSRNKFLIGAYYRPPGGSQEQVAQFMSDLQRSIDVAYTSNHPKGLVLLGNFNDKCQYFDSNHTGSELCNKLLNFSRMNNLTS